MSNSKEYILPNGKKAVFEYDVCGIGKITLECMDELMGMITDRSQGEWINCACSVCGSRAYDEYGYWDETNFCPHCGAKMFAKDTNVPNKKGADDESS